MRARLVLVAATLGCAAAAVAWGGRAPAFAAPEYASAADCDFELIARNSSAGNVYLDLYTSKVINRDALGSSYRDLKMQNARVGPGVTLSPQRVTVNGRCKAGRNWRILYRKGDGDSQMRYKFTDEDTRVSSSSGRRVLDLGDVGTW